MWYVDPNNGDLMIRFCSDGTSKNVAATYLEAKTDHKGKLRSGDHMFRGESLENRPIPQGNQRRKKKGKLFLKIYYYDGI